MLDKLARDPLAYSKPLGGPLEGLRSFRWRAYRVVFKLLTSPAFRPGPVREGAEAIAVLGIGKHSPEQRKFSAAA